MTLQDWIDRYEKKAEKFILLPGFTIHFEPDKGFFCWNVFKNVFEVDHTSTNDIKHFFNKANQMAKERGCTLMRTATYRDPAAYMRLTGAKINLALSSVRPNGKMYWIFEKEVV